MIIIEFIKVTFVLCIIIALIIAAGIGIVKFIDYLDENPYASKDLIQNILYIAVGSHLLFLFIGVPFLQILFSLSIQYSYHCLFDSYPIIKPEDYRFIYGLVGSLINYFLMIRFITVVNIRIITVILCFVVIWITPVCFFFSMSAGDETLFIKSKGRVSETYVGQFLKWIRSKKESSKTF